MKNTIICYAMNLLLIWLLFFLIIKTNIHSIMKLYVRQSNFDNNNVYTSVAKSLAAGSRTSDRPSTHIMDATIYWLRVIVLTFRRLFETEYLTQWFRIGCWMLADHCWAVKLLSYVDVKKLPTFSCATFALTSFSYVLFDNINLINNIVNYNKSIKNKK